ncbi:Deoxyadenosine kinase [Mucinivorans hirudinis]|uniref:Deoxyadenosine kinase n=1 Tax=Mucinivorans hirudinis TaxID=1433126 RepID=A0A060R5T8_9BACT|nr:Deoxyadenosine kinase [Mucinivorans hirudinis]
MYIAIAGNIGSGKSYLTQLLSKRLGWRSHYEESSDNPYIGDFYDNMLRWSFNLQVYFLGRRLEQMVDIISSGCNTVVDRTIFEDARVFATNLHRSGLLSTRDYETYMQIYNLTIKLLPEPDLLIYLRSSTVSLVGQIRKRGRVYESSIEESYLAGLNELYEEWIAEYSGNVLIVDIDKEDFVSDKVERERVLDRISAAVAKRAL